MVGRHRVWLTACLSLGSCGGSPPDSEHLREVQGCVSLPEGVRAATVVNAVEEVRLGADGCFVIQARVEGPQLAVALSRQGDPLRMGWISPERATLDARITAEAVTYYAIGGPLAGLEATQPLFDLLADSLVVDEVADAIDAALTADPRAFSDTHGAVADVVADVAARLLADKDDGGEGSGKPAYAVLINPGDEQSGIRVTTRSGINSVTLVNSKRRAAHAFVERVSTFDADGVETPSEAQITDLEVPSVQSLTGWADGFSQIIRAGYSPGGLEGSEDVAYVPRGAGPVQLDNVEGAARTRYRMVVVGPGLGEGVADELTPAQAEKLVFTGALFLAKDFMLPVFVQHVVPTLGIGDAAGNELVDGLAQDVAKLLVQQLPQAATLMAEGDAMGAVAVGWDAVVGSNTLRDAILDVIIERLYDFRTVASTKATLRASGAAGAFAKATGAVDALLTGGDVSFLAQSVITSNQADAWTLDVADANVRFDPPEADVFPDGSVHLDVRVIDAEDDAVFEYRFSTSGALGSLSNDLHAGDDVTTSQPWIRFDAGPEEGETSVTVEVYEVRLSERAKVGEATASITVSDQCAEDVVQRAPFELERVEFDCTGSNWEYCTTAYFIYRFRAVEGALGYQADIVTLEGGYGGFTDGARSLSPFIEDGRPSWHYYDCRKLDIYRPSLLAQRGCEEGELLYIPFSYRWSDDGDPETDYTDETLAAHELPDFQGSSVDITAICPPEE